MAEPFLFVLMAIGALTGALTVVLARNPVHSAMGLMGTLFSVAVLYVLQLAHLVAAVQIIVYAGAVMTLFLFVIMMIGVDRREDFGDDLPFQRVGVAALSLVIVFFVAALSLFGDFDWVPAATGTDPSLTNGTVQAVAEPMFTRWILAFEATALLLTIAAAGAISLAQYRRRST